MACKYVQKIDSNKNIYLCVDDPIYGKFEVPHPFSKIVLCKEMQRLKNGTKERKMFLKETEQNYEKVKYELNRVKEDKLLNENENNRIKNEKEQMIAFYEIKIKKMKEEYENKIFYLEDINDKQSKKITMVEQKAMEMVKAQQVISEKFKRELNNAINYYEGIISNYQGNK